MVRTWAIALLAILATTGVTAAGGKKDETDVRIEDKLTKDDPKDRKRNAAFKVHKVKMKAGNSYTIDMVSTQFDNYLRLEDLKGKELAEDDDSGGMQNARIIFNCQKDAEYKIIATAFGAEGMGSYVLTVRKTGTAPKLSGTAHAAMVGKAAPDFAGDFALNGKAVKIADLKGKVVLLDFWAVWSPNSVSGLPKLADWHKAHKADGLEVVGVTFYNYENGQNYGFDKESGKLTKPDKADAASERAMLKDFAAHHKLEYLLMLMPKEAALKTFNEYVVNGLPQVVLIDRQGNVRLIVTGNRAKSAETIENEIKKLLAEK